MRSLKMKFTWVILDLKNYKVLGVTTRVVLSAAIFFVFLSFYPPLSIYQTKKDFHFNHSRGQSNL